MYTVYVASDGTGRTAQQAVTAALTQFSDMEVEIVRRSQVRSIKKVRDVVKDALKAGSFVVHTLVSDELRDEMLKAGREMNVDTVDLMGGLLARLSEKFSVSPAEKPGLFQQLNKSYFRRIESMEFAIRHDDGQRVEELKKAEIVILGVSRTFKTPLSIYLAFKEWFVANVPIVLGNDLPEIVYKLDPEKVFCLDTNARNLAELRRARSNYLGGAVSDYDKIEFVKMELMFARKLFYTQPKWSVISVANKPIEEIASEIIALKGKE